MLFRRGQEIFAGREERMREGDVFPLERGLQSFFLRRGVLVGLLWVVEREEQRCLRLGRGGFSGAV